VDATLQALTAFKNGTATLDDFAAQTTKLRRSRLAELLAGIEGATGRLTSLLNETEGVFDWVPHSETTVAETTGALEAARTGLRELLDQLDHGHTVRLWDEQGA
jgi:hypothetical protein